MSHRQSVLRQGGTGSHHQVGTQTAKLTHVHAHSQTLKSQQRHMESEKVEAISALTRLLLVADPDYTAHS